MTKITVDKDLIEQALISLEIGDQFNPGLARATLRAALAEPAVEPVDIEELAHSALQEALSYGLGLDLFVRYFKTVQKASPPPPAEVPLLTNAEVAKVVEAATCGRTPAAVRVARAIEQAVRNNAGLK